MFTEAELNLVAAALEHLDSYHVSLGKSVPGLVASGAIDDARGRCLTLLAKVRRAAAPTPPAEKAAAGVVE